MDNQTPRPGRVRNPYDLSTWGSECSRGFQTFKDASGTHITKGTRRKFLRDGVKVRALASDKLS